MYLPLNHLTPILRSALLYSTAHPQHTTFLPSWRECEDALLFFGAAPSVMGMGLVGGEVNSSSSSSSDQAAHKEVQDKEVHKEARGAALERLFLMLRAAFGQCSYSSSFSSSQRCDSFSTTSLPTSSLKTDEDKGKDEDKELVQIFRSLLVLSADQAVQVCVCACVCVCVCVFWGGG